MKHQGKFLVCKKKQTYLTISWILNLISIFWLIRQIKQITIEFDIYQYTMRVNWISCLLSFSYLLGVFSSIWRTTSCSLLALLHLRLLELHWILQIHRCLQPHQWDGPGLLRPPAPWRHPGIWDQCRTWTLKGGWREPRFIEIARVNKMENIWGHEGFNIE